MNNDGAAVQSVIQLYEKSEIVQEISQLYDEIIWFNGISMEIIVGNNDKSRFENGWIAYFGGEIVPLGI